MRFKKEYDAMLAKFSGNKDLLALIKECTLDWEEEREAIYFLKGEYPPQRNLLMKLKFDLVEKANEIGGEYGRANE